MVTFFSLCERLLKSPPKEIFVFFQLVCVSDLFFAPQIFFVPSIRIRRTTSYKVFGRHLSRAELTRFSRNSIITKCRARSIFTSESQPDFQILVLYMVAVSILRNSLSDLVPSDMKSGKQLLLAFH